MATLDVPLEPDLEEQADVLIGTVGVTLGDVARVYLMAEEGSVVARRTLVRMAVADFLDLVKPKRVAVTDPVH